MVNIETSISQISGIGNFNVYDGEDLIISYIYDNSTKLTNISSLNNDLSMSMAEYVKNVGILTEFVGRIQSLFLLSNDPPSITARNYDYDNGDRKLSAIIDGNNFKVRYKLEGKVIIVKARDAFIFTFNQLLYFSKCHKDFYSKNDLFN